LKRPLSPLVRVLGLHGSLLTISLLVSPAGAQEPEDYDPYAGMDRDGKIERPPLPEDLKNPDRWRYTPPGRIPPGSMIERFLISSFFSPIFLSEQDIGTGGGVAITDIDFRNQKYREFAGITLTYTSEGQQAYSFFWRRWLNHMELPNGGIIREERSTLFGRVGYSRTLTRRFYGFGSRTPASNETSYTEEFTQAGFGARISLPDPGDDLLLNAGLGYQRHNLSRGRVSSVPSTDDDYPGTFAVADGVDQMWVNLGLSYDTRDSLHQPYRGFRLGVGSNTAVFQSDSRFGGIVGMDAAGFFPLPALLHEGGEPGEENPPTDVLAVGGFVTASHGELPFYSLPTLGGSRTLRGYIDNRFTGRAAAHGSLEYRFTVVPRGMTLTDRIRIERFNLGLFYDFGTVANGIEDLDDAKYLYSYGVGLRMSFSREASFRIDYGISDEGGNLIITFGNAF